MDKKLNFENLGIYDLRNYARSLGVVSPTKLKRSELIDKITAIIQGEKPEEKKTNKGRPPKHKITEQSKLEYILPNNLFEVWNETKYQNNDKIELNFSSATLTCKNSGTTTSNILYSGYYKPFNANFGFILKEAYMSKYYKDNVVILNELVRQNNLKEGDFVTGACDYLESKNLMVASSVLTVNGSNQIKKERKDFFDLKIVKPNEILSVSNDCLIDLTVIDKVCPLIKGTRAVLNFDDKDRTKEIIINILNKLNERDNMLTLLICIDDMMEDIIEIAGMCPKTDIMLYRCEMDRQKYFDSLKLKIQYYYRLAEEGKDVVIMSYNTDNLKNNIAGNAVLRDDLSPNSAVVYADNQLKDMFCSARNLNEGSLTMVCVNSQNTDFSGMIRTKIHFNEQKYEDTDVHVNLLESYTRNLKEVFSTEDFNKYKCFRNNLSQDNLVESLDEYLGE